MKKLWITVAVLFVVTFALFMSVMYEPQYKKPYRLVCEHCKFVPDENSKGFVVNFDDFKDAKGHFSFK